MKRQFRLRKLLFFPLNYGDPQILETNWRPVPLYGERSEYLPSATGPFPLLRCFGRAGRALLLTQLGKGVGQLRV